MVDFKKRLAANAAKNLDPIEIYESLDRESGKGPLRPSQGAVLSDWHSARRNQRDVIVKLHTGQGKTLIGLLMLQAKINEGVGPALYLCPDNFLVDQTVNQASQFGIKTVTAHGREDLPAAFLSGKAILVCTVHKLFNGLTKFGLNAHSLPLGSLVIDDAHACIQSIRDACAIRLDRGAGAYHEIRTLFSAALESQGQGTYADLLNHEYDAILPIPYWDWIDHTSDTAQILSKHSGADEIKYAWPLIRDMLADCDCVVTGQTMEIYPRLPPLEAFGSFSGAKHRIFMSATLSDDSFLTKGLGLEKSIIEKPLTYAKEKWSGEKMVLIPSLISEDLTHSVVLNHFAPQSEGRKYGVVVLVPSFKAGEAWQSAGAKLADKSSIEAEVSKLRNFEFRKTLVIANRYDGIDLPDQSCRLLILDSKPRGESPLDRYLDRCLSDTAIADQRAARIIEQGMGRSVRGEKDFSVILILGTDLVAAVRFGQAHRFLSPQTRQQIEVGVKTAEFAQEDLGSGTPPLQVLTALVNQCIKRDDGWKDYYVSQMNQLGISGPASTRLDELGRELKAEQFARARDFLRASKEIQAIADTKQPGPEKGWYVQETARHLYRENGSRADVLQAAAHKQNRFLLLPRSRPAATQLPVEQKRVEKIIDWVRSTENSVALAVAVDGLLTDLRFGVDSDRFEAALDRLGRALGFATERPDKEWKQGPDNLWRLSDDKFLIMEAKSEVLADRKDIAKYEAEQMNQSHGWFLRTYPGTRAECILIVPPKVLGPAASLSQPTLALQRKGLELLCKNVRTFFREFADCDFGSLSPTAVQHGLVRHKLGVGDLLGKYASKIKAASMPPG